MVAKSNTRIDDKNGKLLCTLQSTGKAGQYYVLFCAKVFNELPKNGIVYLHEVKTTLEPDPSKGRSQHKDVTKDLHKGTPHLILDFYRHEITDEKIIELKPIE